MARDRTQLHEILDTLGAAKVYFTVPEGILMLYPAIVYEREYAETEHANNVPYANTLRYQLTLIDQDVDSEIFKKISQLPMCSFTRHFETEGLFHDVFSIYF